MRSPYSASGLWLSLYRNCAMMLLHVVTRTIARNTAEA